MNEKSGEIVDWVCDEMGTKYPVRNWCINCASYDGGICMDEWKKEKYQKVNPYDSCEYFSVDYYRYPEELVIFKK